MHVSHIHQYLSVSGVIYIAGPRVYTHCLFPKCETNAPPNPPSMLAFSQVDLTCRTDSSGVIGPLK